MIEATIFPKKQQSNRMVPRNEHMHRVVAVNLVS